MREVRFLRAVMTALVMSFLLVSYASAENLLFVSVASGSDGNAGTYAAPFKTIERAKQEVRTLKAAGAGPIAVYLREGTYYLDSTLTFDNTDGGSAAVPITWSAFRAEKVTISGGKLLPSNAVWTTHSGKILKTTIDKNLKVDQLFLDGERQIMARYPNYERDDMSDTSIIYLNGYDANLLKNTSSSYRSRVATWKNVTEGPGFIRALHDGRWGGLSYVMTGKAGDTVSYKWIGDNNRGHNIATEKVLKQGGSMGTTTGSKKTHSRYKMVENIFEELDDPGEWFYRKSTGELFFYPPAGVASLSGKKIELASLEELVRIVGASSGNPVSHLTFKNIRFAHTHRTMFGDHNVYEPMLRGDWCVVRTGTVFMHNAANIVIKGCNFDQIGGNAIFLSGYNENSLVYNNRFYKIGASGLVMFGLHSSSRSPSYWEGWDKDLYPAHLTTIPDTVRGPKTNDYPRKITIDNNYFYDIGIFEKQVSCAQISTSMFITIRHNHMDRMPRAAINFNDGCWGGHLVEYNDIRHTVRETSDHGPINAWGRDRYWSFNGYNSKGQDAGHTKYYMPAAGSTFDNYIPDLTRTMWNLDCIHQTIVRYNRMYNCLKKAPGSTDHEQGTKGVDLDDGASNYDVHSNIFIGTGPKFRDGWHRKIRNNIVVGKGMLLHAAYYGWWVRGPRDTVRWGSRDTIKNNICYTSDATSITNGDFVRAQYGVDSNLYFRPYSTRDVIVDKQFDPKLTNFNQNSIYNEDPLFANTSRSLRWDKWDFSIPPNSPALKIGFEPFPLDSFGQVAVPKDTADPISTAVLPGMSRAVGISLSSAWIDRKLTMYYTVDKAARVTVEVFSANGRKVAELYRGLSNAGSYKLVWNGNSGTLGSLAPATYFVAMNVGGRKAVERLMLVR